MRPSRAPSEVTSRRLTGGGFTLIELLVVIAIIGILIALLLPAVQKVREAAHRMACTNNLKQMGLALHSYHDSLGSFPPGATSTPKMHGWMAYLLPYVEQQNLARQYDWGKNWYEDGNAQVAATPLKIVQCPSTDSNRVDTASPGGPTLAAACSDYAVTAVVNNDLADLLGIPQGHNLRGVMYAGGNTRMADITDGTSNTVVVGEVGGRPVRWQRGQLLGGLRSGGGAWADRANDIGIDGFDVDRGAIPGTWAVNCTNDNEIYSFHPGGANFVFADGSVHFVRASIDIRAFVALVTRAGGETVTPEDFN